ncbi:MAG: ferredoxin family protein [Acidobacteria bacterium]|nr:ferredoxin family protein [Acidobacteriota bacterium]
MSRTEGKNLRVVLYEGPGSTPLADDDRFAALVALLDNGFEVTRPVAGQHVAPADDAPVLVLGLLDPLDTPPEVAPGQEVHFRNLADGDLLEAARAVREATGARKLEAWKPWFPVIDFDRCTNCMQCLTFCLFDVYGVDKQQKITVQNQDNCKTDCPACSRVCPEVAILFPKYGKGPINGDVVRAEDIQREAMKVDISTLLGGDLYGSLRSRQKNARKRFSTERDESKALLERKRCLGKLKKDLDIPDEVLMTLPSAGDIAERAARAKAKLAKRQAISQTVKDTRPAPSETEWGI